MGRCWVSGVKVKAVGGHTHIQLAVLQGHLSAVSSVAFNRWVGGRKIGGRAGRRSTRGRVGGTGARAPDQISGVALCGR